MRRPFPQQVELYPHPSAPPIKKYEPRVGPALRYVDPEIDRAKKRAEDKALLDAANLSEAQMFAMMNMSADHRQQAIWHYARQNIFAIPPFTYGTFLQLKELGYAHKPEGEKYHRLTDAALKLADVVADHLQQLHSIHAPILAHPRGSYSADVTLRCTCNWRAQIRTWNLQRNASNAFTRHLITINTVSKIAEAVTISPRHQGEATEEG